MLRRVKNGSWGKPWTSWAKTRLTSSICRSAKLSPALWLSGRTRSAPASSHRCRRMRLFLPRWATSSPPMAILGGSRFCRAVARAHLGRRVHAAARPQLTSRRFCALRPSVAHLFWRAAGAADREDGTRFWTAAMLLRPIVCLLALSLPLSAALALSPELKPGEGAPAAEPAVPPLGSPAPGAGEAPVVEEAPEPAPAEAAPAAPQAEPAQAVASDLPAILAPGLRHAGSRGRHAPPSDGSGKIR